MRTTLLILACLLCCSAATASAQVSDDERAHAHFSAGTSYFEQRRYTEAAQEFMEAYRLSPRGELLLDAASAYERLDQHAQAAEVLQRYLDEQPSATDRATVQGRLTEAQRLAAEEAARAEAQAHAQDAPPPPPPAAHDDFGAMGIAGVVVGALGIVAGIGAIASGVVALDTHASLEARCGAGGTSCPAGAQSDIDFGQAMSTANTVLIPISLVAIATGATLLVLDLTSGPSSPTATTAVILPGPGDVGLSARVTF